MAILSSGQITIIDMYDAPSLNAWISTSLGESQLYDNTTATFSPDYVTGASQVLKLHLTRAGSATDLVDSGNLSNVKWTKSVGASTETIASKTSTDPEYISGTYNETLNVNKNVDKDNSSVTYTVTGTWTDSAGSGLPVEFSAKMSIDLIQLAKAATVIDTVTPKGYFFKNGTPSSLTIEAIIYKDGSRYQGEKLVKWFRSDTSVNSTGNTLYDADAGIGWAKITNTTTNSKEKANETFGGKMTTVTPTLTVYPDGVVNGQTYLVVIEDKQGVTGSGRGTILKDYVTIMDYDDPIQVVIDSSGGEVLKNGQGSTALTAVLYRNGEEIDAYNTGGNYTYTYTWSKYENNAKDSSFNMTGKRITVKQTDVNGKAVFKVEVRNK